MVSRPLEILLVEDSPSDADITAEAFERSGCDVILHRASDGLEALDFLRRQGRHAEAPRPDLILLDLNLPRASGRTVLRELKSDEGLAAIPVVVLTTSSREEDVEESYRLHANCYVRKPLEFKRFAQRIEALARFWAEVAVLPPRSPSP